MWKTNACFFLFGGSFSILMMLFPSFSIAQKYLDKNGEVSFTAGSLMEDISAESKDLKAILDAATGALAFTVQIKSFRFPIKLMEEHFNENYLESEKYPKAYFKGEIVGFSKEWLDNQDSKIITVKGELNIHNVTQAWEGRGELTVGKDNTISLNSSFLILLADYGIVNDKIGVISDEVKTKVHVRLSPMAAK